MIELKIGDTFTAKTTFDGRVEVLNIDIELNTLIVKLTKKHISLNETPEYIKIWKEIWNLSNTLPEFETGEYFLSEAFPEEFPPKDFEN
jgi:hypothetical protein